MAITFGERVRFEKVFPLDLSHGRDADGIHDHGTATEHSWMFNEDKPCREGFLA